MKTMTCAQLGGACNQEFQAQTFKEMAELSRTHAMKMLEQGDQAHIEAMDAMQLLMQEEGALQEWMKGREAAFNAL